MALTSRQRDNRRLPGAGRASGRCRSVGVSVVLAALLAGQVVSCSKPGARTRARGAGRTLSFRIAPVPGAVDTDASLTANRIAKYTAELAAGGPATQPAAGGLFSWHAWAGPAAGAQGLITGQHDGTLYVLLSNQPALVMCPEAGGQRVWGLQRVYETADGRGRPAVGFTFNEAGAKRFAALTGANKGRHLAILVDGEVRSAPVIRAAIRERGIIEMGRANRNQVLALIQALEDGMVE